MSNEDMARSSTNSPMEFAIEATDAYIENQYHVCYNHNQRRMQ